MSLLKRIESARPGSTAPAAPGAPGIPGANLPIIPGGPPSGATSPRLTSQAPVRESFRDVKFRIQNRVIQDLDPKLDLSNQVEVRRQIEEIFGKVIDEEGLANLRVIRHDAVDVLEKMIPDGSLAGLHVFFPDPWPKKRHNKRRIIQPPLVALAAKKLAPGGYIHLATDWQAYAEHMLEVLRAEPLLKNTAPDYAPRPAYRPETKFEARGLRLGHGVWDLVFCRRR